MTAKKLGRPKKIEETKGIEETREETIKNLENHLNDKINEISAQIEDIKGYNKKVIRNKGSIHIRTPIYRIHYDGSFNRAMAKIEGDSILIYKKKYMITANPLRMTNMFGYSKLMYFVSDKTGSTIDFDLLFANKPQFDATTHALWFDKIALQNALNTQKSNPLATIGFLLVGVLLGILIASTGIIGV